MYLLSPGRTGCAHCAVYGDLSYDHLGLEPVARGTEIGLGLLVGRAPGPLSYRGALLSLTAEAAAQLRDALCSFCGASVALDLRGLWVPPGLPIDRAYLHPRVPDGFRLECVHPGRPDRSHLCVPDQALALAAVLDQALREAHALSASAPRPGFCPACQAEVRERPLFTGTFVGCLC